MMAQNNINFTTIAYLNAGNPKQVKAYRILTQNRIMERLKKYDPILVGTIPINIDIENSDLDVICCFQERGEFASTIMQLFGQMAGFAIKTCEHQRTLSVKASFKVEGFEIEIFGQDKPTRLQNAYRHMVIEHRLLCERGEPFRQKVIKLKQQDYKTERPLPSCWALKTILTPDCWRWRKQSYEQDGIKIVQYIQNQSIITTTCHENTIF